MPRSDPGPKTFAPLTFIDPEPIGVNPAMAFRSVDLPHPLGPTRQMNSPAAADKLTPFRIGRWLEEPYQMETSSTEIRWCEAGGCASKAVIAGEIPGARVDAKPSASWARLGGFLSDMQMLVLVR